VLITVNIMSIHLWSGGISIIPNGAKSADDIGEDCSPIIMIRSKEENADKTIGR